MKRLRNSTAGAAALFYLEYLYNGNKSRAERYESSLIQMKPDCIKNGFVDAITTKPTEDGMRAIAILNLLFKSHYNMLKPMTTIEVAKITGIRLDLVESIVNRLVNLHYVSEA
jgi:hypothetical protein